MASKAAFTIFLVVVCCLNSVGQKGPLPRPTKAIICLTYDDGLETQLTTAIPQLDSIGLKATFFLNSIQGSSPSDIIGQTPEAVVGWSQAARKGHELANHTLFHPCPEKYGWIKTAATESYTIDKIITEIRTQNTILSLLDPDRTKRSFAFPCNNVFIGGTDYSKRIRDMGLVTYGRAGGDSSSIITDFNHLNTLQVPSWHVWTGTTLQQLIAFAEKVRQAGGMGIYQFHGVGGQIFQVSAETHRQFLKYLKAHDNEYWVTTFSEAMDFVTNQSN